MSLTDDWRAGKLKDGDYYVRLTNDDIIIEHLCKGEWFFDYGWRDVVIKVLAKVPDYDLWVALTEKVKRQDEEIQKLRKGWELYSHETTITKQLRQLLRECKEQLEYHADLIFCELEGCRKAQKQFRDLLTIINEVLK